MGNSDIEKSDRQKITNYKDRKVVVSKIRKKPRELVGHRG